MDKENMRKYANDVLELTKGISRNNASNELRALDDLSGFVLELTQEPYKKLEAITDEDAIKASEILGGVGHISNEAKIHQLKELLSKYHNGQTNIPGYNWYKLFQFLEKELYIID